MKTLFILLLQLITVGFLFKLAVRLLIPRTIRKICYKSSVTLLHCTSSIVKSIRDDFEKDDDDDIEIDDTVDDGKVILLEKRMRK